MVEQRTSVKDGFGQGRKVPMTLSNFITQINQSDQSLYMTTQDLPLELDGHPAIMGPPLSQLAVLKPSLPLVPPVMGSLVTSSINLWVGCTQDGTSSGLHHDFHDNLYVLLRGRKRFRLFPPHLAARMYTHGVISHIHTNGRYGVTGLCQSLCRQFYPKCIYSALELEHPRPIQ